MSRIGKNGKIGTNKAWFYRHGKVLCERCDGNGIARWGMRGNPYRVLTACPECFPRNKEALAMRAKFRAENHLSTLW